MHLSRSSSSSGFSTPSWLAEPPPSPALMELNAQRLRENARVLALLGTASALGARAAVRGARSPASVRQRAFCQATAGVELFVLGTALVGGAAIRAQRLTWLGRRATLRRSSWVQRLLGVGLGLDVAAAVLGAVLLGSRRASAWREGAGLSLLLHGAALLLVDAGVFRRNARYHRRVEALGRTSSGKVLRAGSGRGGFQRGLVESTV